MKLAIIIGHSDKRKGASMVRPFQFVQEYEYNTILAAQMLVHCHRKKIDAKVFTRDRQGLIGAHRAIDDWRPNCIVELHFNSFMTEEARGCEVLHLSDSEAGKDLAQRILAWLETIIPESLIRGQKPVSRGGRGYKNLTLSRLPTVIVEPFFGSNQEDCELGLEMMSEMAEAVVDGCAEYVSGVVDYQSFQ